MSAPTWGGAGYMGRPLMDPSKLFVTTTTYVTPEPYMPDAIERMANALLETGWMFCDAVKGGGDPSDRCESCRRQATDMAEAAWAAAFRKSEVAE